MFQMVSVRSLTFATGCYGSRIQRLRAFRKVDRGGICFVTRLMNNAAYEVLEEGLVPANRNFRQTN
ncbi:MAG: hypothetical protein EBY17_25180 [Acidobacteriia bacterium]|nr:hypothetical protein [Terriglobia bacterium]